MPFTVSHIAAVIPGHRLLSRAHLFTAAVIGSMSPDFGLLIPRIPARVQTHSALALFTFCLPVGLLVYWVTQLLIRPSMQEILPDRAYARLRAGESHAAVTNIRHWSLAAAVLLLGAVTHLIWDNFTHQNTRGVRMFPVLTDYGPELNGHPLHIYRWLQYGSSVFGLIVVLSALFVWMRHAPPANPALTRRLKPVERAVWMSMYLLLPLVFLLAVQWHNWAVVVAASGVRGVINDVAVDVMRSGAACLVLISVLLRTRLAA